MENMAMKKGKRDIRNYSRIGGLREKGANKQASIHANQKKAKIKNKKST